MTCSPATTASLSWPALLLGLLFIGSATATTLTYKMAPHERACFYTAAKFPGEKIAFYFAVQSGGAFDVDYEVLSPDNTVVLSGQKERQGDFVFSASQKGDYTFCFSNIMSTFSEKNIDFDITAEHETANGAQAAPTIPSDSEKARKAKEEIKPMDEAISRIGSALAGIMRDQRYFKTRENRDFDTVKSTEGRIFWFSVSQSAIIIVTSILQVFVIQTFFSKSSGRGRV
ncbi:hypothetical protein HDU67_007166 [Dinochytrium kinnereticum]|nr:hypothetical protein HDU67_007166 [Dinochytrium kinnereticum]